MNQEDSEQNEVDGMKKGADSTLRRYKGDAYVKERLVICNEDADGVLLRRRLMRLSGLLVVSEQSSSVPR